MPNYKLYAEYIQAHKAKVIEAWEQVVKPKLLACKCDERIYPAIDELVRMHDNSKIQNKDEYEAYAARHYWIDESEINDDAYGKAKNLHINRNPHHPEYYENPDNPTPPYPRFYYLVEMLCDWISVGKFDGSNPVIWYKENFNDIKLSKTDRMAFESLLDIIYGEEYGYVSSNRRHLNDY